jgi:hypothetical protein
MTAVASPSIEQSGHRGRLFRVAVVAATLLFGIAGIGLLAPWVDLTSFHARGYEAAAERWHDAQRGAASGILFGGASLLALLLPSRAQPLLLQFLALAAVTTTALGSALDLRDLAPLVLPAALAVAAFPRPRRLLDFALPGRLSVLLLALSLITAAVLAADVWRSFQLQLGVAGAQASSGHGIATTTLAAVLALAGGLAATKRPGWQALGLLAGATLIYLGLAASVVPAQVGSWGRSGAGLATAGGWAFVAVTWWEARRDRPGEA